MKEYLGDGIYVEIDQFECLVLTTSDGISDTNRIIFEPEVFSELLNYIDRLIEKRGDYINNAINKR